MKTLDTNILYKLSKLLEDAIYKESKLSTIFDISESTKRLKLLKQNIQDVRSELTRRDQIAINRDRRTLEK